MASPVEVRRYTPDELLRMEDAAVLELVDGRLLERSGSTDSSRVAIRVSSRLLEYVDPRGLGAVYDSELGVRAFPNDPGQVRRGDVLFVRTDNVSSEDTGYLLVVPRPRGRGRLARR